MKIVRLESVEELTAWAPSWNRLWLRAEHTAPTSRAEQVAIWLRHFAPQASFLALAIEAGGELLAALPLVGLRLKGLIELAHLPVNPWSAGGDLLVEPSERGDAALELLTRELPQIGWPLLWLEGINAGAANWRRFRTAIERAGLEWEFQPRERVGLAAPGDDWQTYFARRSKNHRKNVRKARERLDQAGEWRISIESSLEPLQVETRMRRAFEVEDRSWKGLAGTSVLKSPGAFEFYAEQASSFAANGLLDLSCLELEGRPIAYEYGYHAHGVYFSHKVGYDELHAALSPGQLLMGELLHRFHADPLRATCDCLGPLSDAVERWTTGSYWSGRLAVAPQRLLSRTLLGAWRAWRGRVRRKSEILTTNV